MPNFIMLSAESAQVSLSQYMYNVNLTVAGIRVAFLSGDSGRLVRLKLTAIERDRLSRLGVLLDGDYLAVS